jgi:SAM-dependent methyltransferase
MADITAGHYFAGTIGLALIRHWYRDGGHNDARMAELRTLLERLDDFPNSLALNPEERDLLAGYEEWSADYDGPNPLIEGEEPLIRPILDRLIEPGCRALDAACGTGRHAAYLAGHGCEVTGVDQSSAMLDVARANVPAATFDVGDVEALTYDDDTFDLVTISLALCHLADPTKAIAELGRVLAAGGSLVITDPHPMGGGIVGGQAFYGGIVPGRSMAWVRNHYHLASTWLGAFAAAGLTVQQCIESPITESQLAATPAMAFFPDAVRSAMGELPNLWVWVVDKPAA